MPFTAISARLARQFFLWLFFLPGLMGLASVVHAQLTVPAVVYTNEESTLIEMHVSCNTDQCFVKESTDSGWQTIRKVLRGEQIVGVIRPLGRYSYFLQRCTLNTNGSTANCTPGETQRVIVTREPVVPEIIAPAEDADGVYSVKISVIPGISEYQLVVSVNGGDWQEALATSSSTTLNETRPAGEYGYRARTCNVEKCSEYSAVVTVRVGAPADADDDSGDADSEAGDSDSGSGAGPGSGDDTGTEVIYGAVPPAGAASGNPVGTLAGDFSVNESGAASYAVKLTVPEGVAGVTPQLSFIYSSQGGAGLLGYGWSLGGLSSITRCRQTVSQDGQARPLTWSDEDRFCLDGQRLMLVSGSQYGAVGATYKTEIDTFVEVTAEGGSAGHPDHFVVVAKDGSTTIYGGTEDSRVVVDGNIFGWSISRVADSIQNHIDFIYEGEIDSGQRISRIDYAYPVPGTSLTPGASVAFTYEDRPDPAGVYVGGHALRQTQRLATVVVTNAGGDSRGEYRRYNLAYQVDPQVETGKISRLESIEECVVSSCYRQTRFEWSAAWGVSVASVRAGTSKQGGSTDIHTFQPIDVNGDGKLDKVWVGRQEDSLQMELKFDLWGAEGGFAGNNTVDVFTATSASDANVDLHVLDYNGDGRQDLIARQQGGAHPPKLYLAEPSDLQWRLDIAGSVELPFNNDDLFFGDLDSDGMSDAYYLDAGRLLVHHLKKGEAGLDTPDQHYAFAAEPSSLRFRGMPTREIDDFWKIHKLVPQGIGDFNGDGRADILVVAERYSIESHTNSVEPGPVGQGRNLYAFTMGDDGLDYLKLIGHLVSNSESVRVLDLNNDGLSDVVFKTTGWQSVMNTGDGFTPATSFNGVPNKVEPKELFFADVNRDGYQDLLWAGSGMGVHYFLPAEDRFTETSNQFAEWSFLGDDHNLVADVDGDGWQDLIAFDASNSSWHTVLSNHKGEIAPNLITEIEDGLGNLVIVDYQMLTGSDHYSRVDIGEVKSKFLQPVCVSDPRDTRENAPRTCHTPMLHHVDTDDFYRSINDPFATLPEGNEHLADGGSPVLEIYTAMPVVTQVSRSSPSVDNRYSMASTSYYYDQLKFQAAGRGVLGFRKLTEVEHQTGLIKESTYRQDWPFVGSPLSTVVKTVHGNVISEAQNIWGMKSLDAAGTKPILQTFIKESIEQNFDLAANGQAQGGLLKRIASTQTYDNYGNLLRSVTVSEGADEVITKTVESDFGDGWTQRFGRLLQSTVTTTRDEESQVRQASFTYVETGPQSGLLESETSMANIGQEVITGYTYDQFGNRLSSITSAADGSVRESESATYDEGGRYLASTTNALGQVTNRVIARNHFGAPTQSSNINGLITINPADNRICQAA